jgi:hypothetical protein
MNNTIFYEPVKERNYERVITTYENEIARLKGELLRTAPASPVERDKQNMLWLELDRLSRNLASLRDQALEIVHLS